MASLRARGIFGAYIVFCHIRIASFGVAEIPWGSSSREAYSTLGFANFARKAQADVRHKSCGDFNPLPIYTKNAISMLYT